MYKRQVLKECLEVLKLRERLPYALTGAQEKVLQEVFSDMAGGRVMNRLIQGDVGSGKTIIAILALLQAAYNGCQGALMVPTEVLCFYITDAEILILRSMSATSKTEIIGFKTENGSF